jgi:hypothetical protein
MTGHQLIKKPVNYKLKPVTLFHERSKVMKATIFLAGLLFAVFFLVSLSYSQVPQMINYQGTLTDDAGNPLDGNYDMTFSIWDALAGPDQLWDETQNGVPVENGVFNVLLGSVELIPLDVFNGDIRFLEITIADDPPMVPRREIVSVAYAFRSLFAQQADDAFYFDENADFAGISDAVIGFSYPQDTPFDRRLRITAGRDDGQDVGNSQGACVDLHGNNWPFGDKNGDLDLVAGEGVYGARGDITFWTGSPGAERMRITHQGKVGIGTTNPTDPLYVYQSNTSGRAACFMSENTSDHDAVGILVSADASNSPSGNAGAATFWAKASENGGHATGVYSYAMAEGVDIARAFYGHARLGNTASFEYAFYGDGDGYFSGYLYKAGGGFKIDHPMDPENKYLYHSFVESPDMMNVYDGNVMLDGNGEATVELPDYFEAVNKDFRYQLTAIGAPGPNLYIAEEISDNRFKLAGGEPGMKVSWQVTGIRKDPFAEADRIQVEVDKPADERGKYIHPEAYGLGEEYGIHYEEYKRIEEELQEKSYEKME